MPRRFPEFGAVLLCLFSSCGRPADSDPVNGVVAALAAAPGMAPRFSVAAPFRRCTDHVPLGGTIPRADCPAPRNTTPPPLALRGIAPGADDPRSVHLLALFDLAAEDPRGIYLERTISSLRRVVELADDPTAALVDLSATLIIRAERTQAPRDLLEAYETAQKAVDRDPRNAAALYNRALALDRFGLVEETAEDWKAAIAAEPASEWAGEAHRRLDMLQAIRPPVPPRDDAPLADYTRYAAEEPQGARELGMDRLLAEWGGAAMRGDAARAEDRLRRAEALGTALLRRPGGDASLADMVRAIRAVAADSAATRKLAEAHREYAEGDALDERALFRQAAQRFSSAAVAADASLPLQAWARLRYGSAVFHDGDAPIGEVVFHQVLAGVNTARHAGLAAVARIQLAVMLARGDRYEAALSNALSAAHFAARARERENEGVALDVASNIQYQLRNSREVYALAHQALQRLARQRGSYRLHNLLSYDAEMFSADGFPHAAVRIQAEGVRVAALAGPVYEIEARLTRARLLLAAGSPVRTALADVEATRPMLPALTDTTVRAWMVAQRQMVEGASRVGSDPARAGELLDSAATFFVDIHAPMLALPAMVDGANARLRVGDTSRGLARLEQALGILEHRRNLIRMEPRRAAVFETARGVVDRIAMLMLAKAGPQEALAYLDRGRASLAPVGDTTAAGTPVEAPPGEVVLEYGLVGDTLLAWTVTGRNVQLFRTVVDTVALFRTIATTLRRLEENAPAVEIRPGLARLYDWLVRPVEVRLGAAGTPLVVVVDGNIAAIPFAALFDLRRERYLIEDHPLRFAVSLREARRTVVRRSGVNESLFVADPEFDPAAHPGFERLKEAADEASEIVTGYDRPRLIRSEQADGATVREAIKRAGILHYAGHAVFDDERPEQSYLLLARTPQNARLETLQAGEIAQLDLHNLSLVVLAACKTVRTASGRAAGFSGLAGAFLAAGAGGTVGSLWEVDDRYVRQLMVPFHDAYRSSGNGPAALRRAQLYLLRSGDAALRSPAAWAGFRYAGR